MCPQRLNPKVTNSFWFQKNFQQPTLDSASDMADYSQAKVTLTSEEPKDRAVVVAQKVKH